MQFCGILFEDNRIDSDSFIYKCWKNPDIDIYGQIRLIVKLRHGKGSGKDRLGKVTERSLKATENFSN